MRGSSLTSAALSSALLGGLWLGAACASVHCQAQWADLPDRTSTKPSPVRFLYPEQVTIPANKPAPIELHFRIKDGLHINSHRPHSTDLIPTIISFPQDGGVVTNAGVRIDQAVYPLGTDISLSDDPATRDSGMRDSGMHDPPARINVYSGEFTIHVKIVAPVGDHLVEGRLRFQACTLTACMPPRTIPVAIEVKATSSH